LRIRVPKRRHRRKRAAYISPATQSLSLLIVSAASGQTVDNQTVNLTPSSPGCSTNASSTICTVQIYLPAGSYNGTLTAYSGTNGKGNILSEGQNVPFTIALGQANHINIAMDGVPASVNVAAVSNAVAGTVASGFTIGARGLWGSAQAFTVNAIDAGGYLIEGPGSPSVSATSSNNAFSLAQPSGSQPNVVVLTPPSNALSSTTKVTASVTPGDGSLCQASDASCSATFNVQYAPYAADDWMTFAHDYQRTALEPQDTGITAATVPQMTQRWTAHLNGPVLGSPLAYKGNVIVVRISGTVYDLSAATGQTIWSRTLSAGVLATPSIDVDDGLLIVGEYANPVNPAKGQTGLEGPSTLYALNLNNGSIAWQQTVPGVIRSAPVYANGVVYEGNAGGDTWADCGNGGVFAFNSSSGAQLWNWMTNPYVNPGGGGGVWGAIAWDGSHIVFGTGNTCQATFDMQGAVALNTDGSLAWYFSAEPTIVGNYDTGGGVMISHGGATFINKNGTLYTLDTNTGNKLMGTPLGAVGDDGGFASPGTDGSTVVIGAGNLPTSSSSSKRSIDFCIAPDMQTMRRGKMTEGVASAGYASALRAVNSTGTIVWSVPMSNVLIGYVAVNNGIVYAGLDNGSAHDIDAINMQDGTILAQFAGANTFTASPVVVPSGVYGVDASGNVYALTLPASVLQTGVAKVPGLRDVPVHSGVR
jgi:outer membrane protein assembly factor BamB